MMKAYTYTISGIVQGVGFRYFTRNTANRMGLKGYVKNLSNRNVEAYAIGTEEELTSFENELKRGPYGARVDSVAKNPSRIDDSFTSFKISF